MQKFRLNDQGQEVPDPTPMAPPVSASKPFSLRDQVRQLIREERFNAGIAAQGRETFEEADDFEIDEDDPQSLYEVPEAEFEPEGPDPGGPAAVDNKLADAVQSQSAAEPSQATPAETADEAST